MVEGILNNNEDLKFCVIIKRKLLSRLEYDENSFQTAIELILPSNCFVPEMRLIVEKFLNINMDLLTYFCVI
jgi:hypothetical protein